MSRCGERQVFLFWIEDELHELECELFVSFPNFSMARTEGQAVNESSRRRIWGKKRGGVILNFPSSHLLLSFPAALGDPTSLCNVYCKTLRNSCENVSCFPRFPRSWESHFPCLKFPLTPLVQCSGPISSGSRLSAPPSLPPQKIGRRL